MDGSKKRRREQEKPRITYHAPTRMFDRLFKEESLAEMKEVARRKLGLSSTTPISLAQIREGKIIDLDDDDDFDAFYAVAHSTSLVNVQIIVGPEVTVLESDNHSIKKKRKRLKSSVILPEDVPGPEPSAQRLPIPDIPPTNQLVIPITTSEGGDVEVEVPESISVLPQKKGKRKASPINSSISARAHGTTHSLPTETSVSTSSANRNKRDMAVVVQGQGVGGSKNARRRKRKISQQQSPSECGDSMDPEAQKAWMLDENPTEPLAQELSINPELPFANQLASAISKTQSAQVKDNADVGAIVISDTVGKRKRSRENRRILDADERQETRNKIRKVGITTDSNDSSGKTKRLSAVSRKSTREEELEAANADVRATALRILAAKRASLVEETISNLPARSDQQSFPFTADGPQTSKVQPEHSSTSLTKSVTDEGNLSHVTNLTVDATSVPPSVIPLSPLVELGPANLESSLSSTSTGLVTSRLPSNLNSSPDMASNIPGFSDTPDSHNPTTTLRVLGNTYANLDLAALIRGPKVPLMIRDISSSSSSDGEEEYMELEEDTQEPGGHRSVRHDTDSSSDVETDDEDPPAEMVVEDNPLPPAMEARIGPPQRSSTPFRTTQSTGPLQDADHLINTEFEGAPDESSDTISHTTTEKVKHSTSSLNVLQQTGAKYLMGKLKNSTSIVQASGLKPSPTVSTITTESNMRVLGTLPEALPNGDMNVLDIPLSEGVVQIKRDRNGDTLEGSSNSVTASKFEKPGNSESGTQRTIAGRTRSVVPSRVKMLGNDYHSSHSSASVLSAKGKVQRTTVTGAPTPSPTPPREASANMSEGQSSTKKTLPLNTWVTLKPSSPLLDAEATIMVDELESSSPFRNNPSSDPQSPTGEPLFNLTESQVPFPYSQWAGTGSEGDHQAIYNDSEDEERNDVTIQTQSQLKNPNHYSAYRTLTDIASQKSLFATPSSLKSTQPRVTKHKLADLYGPRSQAERDESESDPDPDSDSDANVLQKTSHIPEGRRAGVIQKRKS